MEDAAIGTSGGHKNTVINYLILRVPATLINAYFILGRTTLH